MKCDRMQAIIFHDTCLLLQQFYTYLGEPCANCPQGERVRGGDFSDEDIIEIKKLCENRIIFVRF